MAAMKLAVDSFAAKLAVEVNKRKIEIAESNAAASDAKDVKAVKEEDKDGGEEEEGEGEGEKGEETTENDKEYVEIQVC